VNIIVKNVYVGNVMVLVFVSTIKEICYAVYAVHIYGANTIDSNVNVRIVGV
jgi:hypothetical protein